MIVAQNKVDISKLQSSFALTESRIKYKNELNSMFVNTFSGDVSKIDESFLRQALYKAELTLDRSELVRNGILNCFQNFNNFSNETKKGIFLAAKACFPNKFIDEVFKLYNRVRDPEIFAYSALYLLDSEYGITNAVTVLAKTKDMFGSSLNDPFVKNLIEDLDERIAGTVNTPELRDLLAHDFQKGKTIIYSLHRKSRKNPGITIIKKPDGKFVRNDDGSIFYIKQLAVSASAYPGYLKGGNTPQGIFSIQAFYVSETEDIGPTPCVLTRIAFEKPVNVFYHNKNQNSKWSIKDYTNLLPESWQNYFPLQQAYYAGQFGRRLIVMHGSVDDPEFYKNESYFPLTPTRGCISSTEVWSEETGKCLESDQVKLMNAFFSTKQLYGFLIVADLDNQNKPVAIEEIIPFIE